MLPTEYVMKKTLKNILAAVICILCLTGCIRLEEESGLLTRKRGHVPPPYHFYMGSKSCVGMSFYFWPYAPIILLDLPLELVADTLFLPHDAWLYYDYKNNPPLALLVKEKRYDELEKRLKEGEELKKYDWRMINDTGPVE